MVAIEKLVRNLQARRIQAVAVENVSEALSWILREIPPDATVGFGNSQTLKTMDLARQTQFLRARHTAAPRNARRAGLQPPCVELGRCVDCRSEDRVCNSLVVIEGQSDPTRITVVIVNQELGF